MPVDPLHLDPHPHRANRAGRRHFDGTGPKSSVPTEGGTRKCVESAKGAVRWAAHGPRPTAYGQGEAPCSGRSLGRPGGVGTQHTHGHSGHRGRRNTESDPRSRGIASPGSYPTDHASPLSRSVPPVCSFAVAPSPSPSPSPIPRIPVTPFGLPPTAPVLPDNHTRTHTVDPTRPTDPPFQLFYSLSTHTPLTAPLVSRNPTSA